MKVTNIDPATATKDLQSLTDAGFNIRHSPTKSTSTDYLEIVNGWYVKIGVVAIFLSDLRKLL